MVLFFNLYNYFYHNKKRELYPYGKSTNFLCKFIIIIYFIVELFMLILLKLEYFSPFKETFLPSGFGLGIKRHIWQMPFEERLFSKGLRNEITPLLSPKEWDDIQINLRFIH